MTPDRAYSILQRWASGGATQAEAAAAWNALDDGLIRGEPYPVAWLRLTNSAAARRAGKTARDWATLVSIGYAPAPDGWDEVGRGWWLARTCDDFREGNWVPAPRDPGIAPPSRGRGATSEAWRRWAASRGVAVPAGAKRTHVQSLCRRAGVWEG